MLNSWFLSIVYSFNFACAFRYWLKCYNHPGCLSQSHLLDNHYIDFNFDLSSETPAIQIPTSHQQNKCLQNLFYTGAFASSSLHQRLAAFFARSRYGTTTCHLRSELFQQRLLQHGRKDSRRECPVFPRTEYFQEKHEGWQYGSDIFPNVRHFEDDESNSEISLGRMHPRTSSVPPTQHVYGTLAKQYRYTTTFWTSSS